LASNRFWIGQQKDA